MLVDDPETQVGTQVPTGCCSLCPAPPSNHAAPCWYNIAPPPLQRLRLVVKDEDWGPSDKVLGMAEVPLKEVWAHCRGPPGAGGLAWGRLRGSGVARHTNWLVLGGRLQNADTRRYPRTLPAAHTPFLPTHTHNTPPPPAPCCPHRRLRSWLRPARASPLP